MRRCHSSRKAFTLLEVVISLALFAVGVSVLSSAYINVLNAMDRLEVDQAFEQDMALVRRMALMVGSMEELEDGGEISTANHGIATWEGEYEETIVADLFKITLIVEFPSDGEREEQTVRQEMYLTRPNWSDPIERDKLRSESRERFEDIKTRRNRS